jgi:hypothetical protein
LLPGQAEIQEEIQEEIQAEIQAEPDEEAEMPEIEEYYVGQTDSRKGCMAESPTFWGILSLHKEGRPDPKKLSNTRSFTLFESTRSLFLFTPP